MDMVAIGSRVSGVGSRSSNVITSDPRLPTPHTRARVLASIAILLLAACAKQKPIVVGSKNFTESVLLGEIVAQRLERAGCTVERKLDLGGTLVCDKAITAGSLDVYPEYSGTALTAILHHDAMRDRAAVMKRVAADYSARGLSWGPALGFENTFAMIVRSSDAQRLSLKTISDLGRVSATFRPGFGYEFVERPDGWNGLLQHYGLRFAEAPRTMDLGLTYRALAAGEIDLIAGNSTDGLIDALGLTVLADDKHFFPPYDAALVVRRDLGTKCPAGPAALASLVGRLDATAMRRLNLAIDRDKRSPSEVARTWLKEK